MQSTLFSAVRTLHEKRHAKNGHVAYHVYGKQIDDAVFLRITL